MRNIGYIVIAAWLLLFGGATQIKTWLTSPNVAQVGNTIQAGAQVLLTPQPTPRVVFSTPVGQPPRAQSAGGVSVSNVAAPTPFVTATPSPLPTVAPAIPLDKGEYTFLDRGINSTARYCVQMPDRGVEICDPDISMTYPDTQTFIARSLKLGTMAGTPIGQ